MYGPYRLSYMMLGIVATALFLENVWRIAGTSLLILFDSILIAWRMNNPDFVATFAAEENFASAIVTFLIACISIMDCCASDFMQYSMSSKKIPMTFSGGEAVYHNEDMLVKLFNIADQNLYEAKNAGKQRIIYERAGSILPESDY